MSAPRFIPHPAAGADKTGYAMSCGYTGRRPVIVADGRVISHRHQDWFEFLRAVRGGQVRRSQHELCQARSAWHNRNLQQLRSRALHTSAL